MVVLAQKNAVSNEPGLTKTEEGTLAKGEGAGPGISVNKGGALKARS